MGEPTPTSKILVLMFTDLVDSSALKVTLGDRDYVRYIAQPHNEIFRQTVSRFPGAEENNFTGDGFLSTFERVSDAINAALLFHVALRTHGWQRDIPLTRIGIHLGESVLYEGADASQQLLASHAADMCARVMGMAVGGQTLLTRAAFDNGRQYIREHPTLECNEETPRLEWLAHGRYQFQGKAEPMEIFEVGAVGRAPLRAPEGSEKAARTVSPDEVQTSTERSAPVQDSSQLVARNETASLHEEPTPASNLPEEITSFVGREDEIEKIQELLQHTRLLTLTGVGGAGKTR